MAKSLREPHLEHVRHRDFTRVSRQGYLKKWLASFGTSLTLNSAEAFNMLKAKGADFMVKAITSFPQVRTKPTITGTTTNGQTLTCVAGTYGGKPAPTITRAWLRNGVVVAGQTAATYVLGAPDVGTRISVRETATNTAGVTTNTSAQTAVVA
jgi:hypothetical protein